MGTQRQNYTCLIFLVFCHHVHCQWPGLFNAALGKPTWQSSTYGEHSSGRAVDGCDKADLNDNCCTHTLNTPYTWWSVDLGGNYTLREIRITNRRDCCDFRLQRFKIYGSFVSGQPSLSNDKVLCAEQGNNHVESLAIFRCHHSLTTRFILIEKNMPSDGSTNSFALTLCEVQVIAECLAGRYGLGCTEDCSPYCRDGAVCDKYTGECPDRLCTVGYRGAKCDKSCNSGYYGENCQSQCSPYCQEDCDKFSVTGSCSGKCVPGYTSDSCTQECEAGFYGEGCLEECHCLQDFCNHTSGCMGGCLDGWEGDGCLQRVVDPSGSNGGNAALYGSIVGILAVVLLIAVILFIIFYKRRKQRRMPGKPKASNEEELDFFSKPMASGPEVNQNGVGNQTLLVTSENAGFNPDMGAGYESQISDEEDNDVADTSNVYMNVDANHDESRSKIKQENLSEYIGRQKKEAYPFNLEYESIPKQTSPWMEAAVPELKSKNRYRNILPYDYNRVVLSKIEGDKFSDYINASYIKDYEGNTSYIAALGVTKGTLVDFWRMIWEQDVSTVMMVTNLYEEGKIKCDQYWPSDKQVKIGPFTVALTLEETHPSFVLRKMAVSKDEKTKKLSQYHYTDWPDKGAPTNLRALLKLREVLLHERSSRSNPVVVHCSAGVGRTGTIIALDILLDQLKKEKAVDVRQCVVRLRKQRTNMIQTLTQYIFLYEALEEMISIGDTTLSCQNLKSLVKKDGAILYEKQFKFLERCKPKFKDTDLYFGRVDHLEKNRDINVVPAYDRRAKIPSHPEIYVNAVHVKGYKSGTDFCVTQIPLKNTITDFWCLMTELKSAVIVCFQSDETDTNWLPAAEAPLVCGQFTLKLDTSATFNLDGWTEYSVTAYKQEAVLDTEYANVGSAQVGNKTQVLVVKGNWASSESEERCVTLFGNLYRKMDKLRQGNKNKLVTVMCLNGAEESGLFVGGSLLMDMSADEGEIDVFHTLKQIRVTRPEFVNSLDQYMLLHRLPAGNLLDKAIDSDYYNV